MALKPLIAPSILSADFTRLGEEIAKAEEYGADWLHIDVMDGHFVDNITMGPLIVAACKRASELPLDVHLMIEKPEKHLLAFARAGADHLTVHVEACADASETLQNIRKLGCKAGLALNPETAYSQVEGLLDQSDVLLVMSVHPGHSGQAFIPDVLTKVKQASEQIEEEALDTLIEIDGGINPQTAPQALEAGADVLVAASAIFKHEAGIAAGIQSLRDATQIEKTG